MIGDGERVAIASIAGFEFAFEVRAPQIVGMKAARQGCAGGLALVRALRPLRLTKPWRSITACTVEVAGMRTSPASFLTNSSRIFLAPQWGLPFFVSMMSRSTGSGNWLA